MKTFLGRKDELETIDRIIGADGGSAAVTVYGPGGIGKTRLLHELYNRYSGRPGYAVIEIIDFDLPRYDFLQVIGRHFAERFPDAFAPFAEADYLRQRVEEGMIDGTRLAASKLDLEHVFIACANDVASRQRVVLLFDTVEKVVSRYTFALLLRVFAGCNNTAFAFAGRRVTDGDLGDEPLERLLGQFFGPEVPRAALELTPFDERLAGEYIRRSELPHNLRLDAEWQRKITLLAAGRPIIIDLAVEGATRLETADWFRSLPDADSLAALQQSQDPGERQRFEEFRQGFDRELVSGVRTQRSPLDQLTLLLMYVSPLRRSDLVELLSRDQEVVNQLFARAQDRAPYKVIGDEQITLHDVARDLLLDHVLPVIDADGERRAEILGAAIDLFKRESFALAEQIGQRQSLQVGDPQQIEELYADIRTYQQLRARIAEYTFQLDPLRGVRELTDELRNLEQFQGIRGDVSALYEAIQSFLPAVQQVDPEAYWVVHIAIADSFVAIERFAQARALYEGLTDRIGEQPLSRRITIARRRGAIEMAIGQVHKAFTYFSQAAELAEQAGDRFQQARALISCGWAARSHDMNLNPVRYYQQALRLVMDQAGSSEEARQIQATALNGMSYVYALEKRREARDLLDRAIAIRRGLGAGGRYQLGQSYSTAGEVYNELNEPYEALRQLELAEQIFIELDTTQSAVGPSRGPQPSQWLGKIYSARGRAHSAIWELTRREDPDQAARSLQLAEETLLLAVQQAIAADLPRALQRLGFVYAATPERRPQAVQTWLKAYEQALKFGDILTEFNAVSNLALMATYGHTTGQFPDLVAFDRWVRSYAERSEGAHFEALAARFDIYRGALALQASDHARAFELLDRGLSGLERRELDVSYSFRWQLDYLERDIFPGCEPALVCAVAEQLARNWMERGIGVAFWERFTNWSRPHL